VLIRHADPARDAAGCAAIYSPYVAHTVISLEEEPPGPGEFADRIEQITSGYPWLVAEDGGVLTGYAYASRHHERAAYRWAADVALYVGERHRRQGVGRALYGALLPLLVSQGLQTVCAGITLPNDASVGLHEAFGFSLVGVYRRVAWKIGAWQDVGWWQLELVPPGQGRPPELGLPVRLDPA
jgi:L-amino acid N-acyltransferase YncA